MNPEGFLARLRHRLRADAVHDATRAPHLEAPQTPMLRLEASATERARKFLFGDAAAEPATAHESSIMIRRQLYGLEDARYVIHGLRSGNAQIVNLGGTTAEAAERILDFLSGAVEALDGEFEHLGQRLYLFSPPSMPIQIDVAPESTLPSVFSR